MSEENLEEGLRLIKTHTSADGKKTAKVYKDNEWGEHRVKFHRDGKHLKDADYHTDDAYDAHDTARHYINESNGDGTITEDYNLLKTYSNGHRTAKVFTDGDGKSKVGLKIGAGQVKYVQPEDHAHAHEIARDHIREENMAANIIFAENYMAEEYDENKPMEAHGVKGLKSTPWRKSFKSHKHFEKWAEKNEGNVEVHGVRNVNEDQVVQESSALETMKPNSRPAVNPDSKLGKISTVIGAMSVMNREDLTKWFDQAMALIGKEARGLPANASSEHNQGSIDTTLGAGPKTRDPMPKLSVKEDLDTIFVGDDLSEEFKLKLTALFEVAVDTRVNLEFLRLQEKFDEIVSAKIDEINESLTTRVDAYLDESVKTWMTENQVAIETSLKNEISEEFITGLKDLFEAHYINIPEDKYDVVESLANRVIGLEENLDKTILENKSLKDTILENDRSNLVAKLAEGMTLVDSEKFKSLAESVSFDGDLAAYEVKLQAVKEGHFPKTPSTSPNLVEETFEVDTVTNEVVDPSMQKYVSALSRLTRR